MNLKDIKVIDGVVPFEKVAEFIRFVVTKSFGEDGMYHKYLRDFAEASAIITMYTDYDSKEFDLSNVIDYIQSDEWYNIKQQLGTKYTVFHNYVEDEITNLNTPLRFADNAIRAITLGVNKINSILSAIDVEQLKGYDFTKLVNAIDAVSNYTESEAVEK